MAGIVTSVPPLVQQPPGQSSSNPAGLPGVTYTVANLNLAQTWGAKQTFPLGNISLNAADITSGTLPAAQMPALTGDVTTVAGAVATTIAPNAVTNAKAAQMAAYTIKGNATGATANATDIDVTALTAKAAPVPADIVLIQDSAASNAFKKTTAGALASAGVSIFNVANYGALPDFHEAAGLSAVVGATITGGTTVNPFTASDVGSLINLTGAGVAGADYFGTITGFTNTNTVSVSPNTSTAVTNVYGQWGKDNTSAIQAAIDAAKAAGGGTILIPTAKKYCVQQLNCTNAPPIILKGVSGVVGSLLIPMRSTNSVIDVTGTEAFNMRDISVGFSTRCRRGVGRN
jgi:hypothetical protein